jgi:hypothetical protein
MAAMALMVVFLSGIHLMNARVWAMLGSGLNSIAATRSLNGRAEQLRASTWDQITDADYLAGASFLGAPGDSAGDLGALTETVDVTAYQQAPGTVAPLHVTRNADGTVTSSGDGANQMPLETSVQVNLTVSWTAKGGASHTRQLQMTFTNGGVTGRK